MKGKKMNNEQNSPAHLVRDIFATRDDEIQCKEAGTLIVRCADALLSDEQARRQYPALWHHFRFCPDCAQEYRMVIELARLEAAGQLERPAHIPPLPDGGGPTVWKWATDALTALFPGFPLALVEDGARSKDWDFEPVEVTLAQGELQIALDTATNELNAGLCDLFCTVSTAAQETLEGAPVWLQLGDEGPAVREEALDELGDVSFARLQPGRYTLRLHLAGREYVVTGIVLPGGR
jgi:hypothetical protein